MENDQVDFQMIAESMPHMVWTATAQGENEYVNRRGCEFVGYDAGEIRGWTWLELLHPEDADRALREWLIAIDRHVDLDVVWRIRRGDGEYRRVRVQGSPVRDKNGEILRWIGTSDDIEDQSRLEESVAIAERRASESLTLLKTLQDAAPIGIGFLDCDLRVIQVNAVLAAMANGTAEEHIGRPLGEILDPALWKVLAPLYERTLKTREALVNEVVTFEDPQASGTRTALLSLSPVVAGDELMGLGVIAVDITERQQNIAFRDIVMDTMAEGLFAIDRNGSLTFMNAAAEKILGWTEIELRGKNIHDAIHFQHPDGRHHHVHECPLYGIREYGDTIRAIDDVFTRKDGTMVPVAYSGSPLATGAGVDGVVVVFRDITDEKSDQARVQQELNALSWVGRIRDAIDEDRLVLYSQPILPMTGGEASCELLLRMIGHDQEVIAPGAFLPVAEKYGLITEIDRWVVAQGIGMAAKGRRVEINLSAESIASLDLLPLIERELRESGADPSFVVFEITETALLRVVEQGETFARGLSELGCGVALDDFGTGFGSFTYLKRLPIKYLKIDIDFVRDLPDNPANQHLVKATVNLAQSFGQQTIAEGVEDEATLQLLKEYGVDFAQGFHLGRPAPIVDDTAAD